MHLDPAARRSLHSSCQYWLPAIPATRKRNATQAQRRNIYTEAVLPVPHAASPVSAIDWYRFLERPRLPSPAPQSLEQLRDASILVTGAGGSIGSALSLQLARLHLRNLVLLDTSEQALHRLQWTLADAALPSQPHLVLANIQDKAHLEQIFATHLPQIVLHAAAYKHVPLLEEHPLEALGNNALGTLTLADCAKKFNAARFVLLSTDKAVAPISILGASKRIAEQIAIAHQGIVLRLGNVLGSEGSVSETFLRQIASGSSLTITNPHAERYFLTCEEAVDLMLLSATVARAGSLIVPRLSRQHKIASLAEFLLSARPHGVKPPIAFTSPRPGDKIRESLWASDEQPLDTATPAYFEIETQPFDLMLLRRELQYLENTVRERDLQRALQIVLQLVPTYTPSLTVQTLLQASSQGALQR